MHCERWWWQTLRRHDNAEDFQSSTRVKGRGNWNGRSRSGGCGGHHRESRGSNPLKLNFAARYTLGTWVWRFSDRGLQMAWNSRFQRTCLSNPLLLYLAGKLYIFSCTVQPDQVSFPDGKVWSMQRAEVEGKRSIHSARCVQEGGSLFVAFPSLVSFNRGIIQEKRFFERASSSYYMIFLFLLWESRFLGTRFKKSIMEN